MERIRIKRKPVTRKTDRFEVLPLDPRDPDVVRAKALLGRNVKPRPLRD